MNKATTRNEVMLYKTETLVYEEGDWGLITDSDSGVKESAYATHHCENTGNDESYPYGEICWTDCGEDAPECGCCEQPVPDSIVTLVRIYNWER